MIPASFGSMQGYMSLVSRHLDGNMFGKRIAKVQHACAHHGYTHIRPKQRLNIKYAHRLSNMSVLFIRVALVCSSCVALLINQGYFGNMLFTVCAVCLDARASMCMMNVHTYTCARDACVHFGPIP